MPRPSSLGSSPRKTRKQANLANEGRYFNKKKKSKHSGGHKGKWKGVQDDSPLKELPKQGTKRAREPYVPPKVFAASEPVRPPRRGAKTGMPKMRPSVEDEEFYPIIYLDEGQLDELEAQWLALKTYTERRSRETMSNKAIDELAEQLLGKSGRTLRNLADRADTRGSLRRKIGSGAPRTVFNPEVIAFIETQAAEWAFEFSHEAMALVVKGEFGVGSKDTVQRILYECSWKRVKQHLRPFLTEAHMKARIEHAKAYQGFNYFTDRTVVVHIDEKWFYAFRNGRTLYVPPGVEAPSLPALSKTQIPKVMYLCAVAAPRRSRGFDGKIGLWMVGEEYTALRKSRFHDKGDVYMVSRNMDGDFFSQMVEEKLIPAILEKCSWADNVRVQLDSAGGHRILEMIPRFNEMGKKTKVKIEFVTQPTRSPDCNILDLGIWNSLQSHVPTVRYGRSEDEPMEIRIQNEVENMWNLYPGYEKLEAIFHTLKAIHRCIIDNFGGNKFKPPRKAVAAVSDPNAIEERPNKRIKKH
jgi:hypothetical protein